MHLCVLIRHHLSKQTGLAGWWDGWLSQKGIFFFCLYTDGVKVSTSALVNIKGNQLKRMLSIQIEARRIKNWNETNSKRHLDDKKEKKINKI